MQDLSMELSRVEAGRAKRTFLRNFMREGADWFTALYWLIVADRMERMESARFSRRA